VLKETAVSADTLKLVRWFWEHLYPWRDRARLQPPELRSVNEEWQYRRSDAGELDPGASVFV
jgi:hypothetical protein